MLSASRAIAPDDIAQRIRDRARYAQPFFEREAPRLARAAREMAQRFLAGGRLYAFGHGPYATDAMHVAVEFVHPVLVGKRALPGLDLSLAPREWASAVILPNDMAIGFGPPDGDPEIDAVLRELRARGTMTIAFPGGDADYAPAAPCEDPHVHQEIFELLGHALYETVHVFLEHRDLGGDVGASSFLYPFLGAQNGSLEAIEPEATASILTKAADAQRLRDQVADEQAGAIASAVSAIGERIARGGRLLLFGNGGSATDALDWTLDCVLPSEFGPPIPAICFSNEPACITAIANDVGTETIFLRQLIAHASEHDVAIALSTSGGSRNVVMALQEARRRGLLTVALLGYDGGEIVREKLVDHPIVVRSDYIPRIQEAQAAIYHVMREMLARPVQTAPPEGVMLRYRSMAEQGGREADDASKPAGTASIELYGAASCPFTTEAREQLEYEGRDFIEYDVERDASAFVRLAKLLGDTKPMVPVVVENGSVKSIGRQGRGCYVNRP